VNADELWRLHELLTRSVALAREYDLIGSAAPASRVARLSDATLHDYESVRELVGELAWRAPQLEPVERERLELNADLPQLGFHLGEELDALQGSGAVDGERLARSLTFLRRHLVRLRAEYSERAYERLEPLDLELILGLARLARRTYERRFAAHYLAAGDRRPYVDKLYRDYALSGIPDGLLLALAALAERDEHDLVICVLRGGHDYTLLLELCGLPAGRVRHVMCGRAGGSHLAANYVLRPIDFDFEELAGRSLLVVENNAATGATLAHLAAAVRTSAPTSTTLFLDYILTDVGGLTPAMLVDEPRFGFARVVAGPFGRATHEPCRVRALKQDLIDRLGRHLP
jgi:hypothetical protein